MQCALHHDWVLMSMGLRWRLPMAHQPVLLCAAGSRLGELQGMQVGVSPVLCQQIAVPAAFDDTTAVHD